MNDEERGLVIQKSPPCMRGLFSDLFRLFFRFSGEFHCSSSCFSELYPLSRFTALKLGSIFIGSTYCGYECFLHHSPRPVLHR